MTKKLVVKFKKLHPDAQIPKYAHPGDAGLDLVAVGFSMDASSFEVVLTYDTGISIKVPEGHVGLLFPRSSIVKTDLTLANSVGVIDSTYVGPILVKFKHHKFLTNNINFYKVGDKIAQLVIVPIPQIELDEVEELEETERGDGGFGSTGR
jgi:dUTP pyrophosphatase